MIHWYLTGFERGAYNDSSIRLSEECFGDYYVTKVNEYEYLFKEDPFGNVMLNMFPELSLTYQFYYMWNNQCNVDETINDFMVFCWYKGCWPKQILFTSGTKILYVMRAINDALIIWYEGVPEDHEESNMDRWITLSEATGRTAAEIL
jgi:hypothetical protein